MRRISLIIAALAVATFAANAQKSVVGGLLPPLGQMPTNDDKMYEYHGIIETDGTGSGDIEKRIRAWFKSSEFADAKMSEQEVEEKDGDYLKMKVTNPMVESYFSVQRKHSNRELTYMVKFKFDRKEFEYWINEITYKAKEDYPKGVTDYDVVLEEFKGPTAISVRQEIDTYFRDLIESAELAANTELAEVAAPAATPVQEVVEDEEIEMDVTPEVEETQSGETEATDTPAQDETPSQEESEQTEDTNSPE